uniref:G protein-coupled receptor n=1 Tax=Pristionchus pacificus TaxID=54126 RepID=A0A8R1UX17_PRIPA
MDNSEWNFTISCCRDAILTMKGAETIAHCVLVILSFAYLWVLLKAKILHVNLRFFLLAFSFNDSVIALNRIPDILKNDGMLVDSIIVLTTKYACIGLYSKPIKKYFTYIGWIMGVITLLNIMMERVFAFWYYQKYDDSSNSVPYIPMVVIIAQYSIFGFQGFAVTQKWISFETHILVLFTLSIMTYLRVPTNKHVFKIFPISQWIMMKRIKRREESRFEKGIYNVNGRFQNHDIRRCVRMLRNYVFFQGFCWFLAVTVSSYFQFFVVPNHPEHAMLAEQIGYVINNPRAIISMLIPIAYHTGIQQTLVRMLKRRPLRKQNRGQFILLPGSNLISLQRKKEICVQKFVEQ